MRKEKTEDAAETARAEAIHRIATKSQNDWRKTKIINSEPEDGRVQYAEDLKELDLQVDRHWMRKNSVLVKPMGNKGKGVNIAQLDFDSLPPSHQEDILETVTFAYDSVERAEKNGIPLDENFIDKIADTIHEKWMARNRKRVERDIERLVRIGDAESLAEIERRNDQFLPYSHPKMQKEREYERKPMRLALADYREHHPNFAAKMYLKGDVVSVSPVKLDAIRNAVSTENLSISIDGVGEVVSVLGSQALVLLTGFEKGFAVDFSDLVLVKKPNEEKAG